MSDSLHSKKSLFTEENSQNKKTNLERSESRIFQVEAVRKDFPVLRQTVNGKPLVWLDNAATTQKPQSVIDSISDFYENYNSNIHRGAHTLAAHATEAYENAREKVRRLINASSKDEIIYIRGTTEGINLISNTFGKQQVGRGDEIIVSELEHHANIVPWQMLAQDKGASLRVIPIDSHGDIMMEEYQKLFNHKTRIVAIGQVSNAIGRRRTISSPCFTIPVVMISRRVMISFKRNIQHMSLLRKHVRLLAITSRIT